MVYFYENFYMNITQTTDKIAVFTAVKNYLTQLGLPIVAIYNERPWGGFLF
jgi:hypothetical protein